MKRIAFLLLFVFLAKFSFANERYLVSDTAYPTYSLQKDKHWLDSLKYIVKKGYPDEQYSRNFNKRKLSYFESCEELGVYYERLYDFKQLPNMKKALLYYLKVTDFGRILSTPDIFNIQENYKAAAIKTTLYRKLADIYFKGKGVKKDLHRSFDLALDGCTNGHFCDFYSKRYFGTKSMALSNFSNFDFAKDSVFEIVANPFWVRVRGYSLNVDSKDLLKMIGNLFQQKFASNGYRIEIMIYPRANTRDQDLAGRILQNLNNYLIDKIGVIPDNIYMDAIVDGGPFWWVVYKKFECPYVQISFTKKNDL